MDIVNYRKKLISIFRDDIFCELMEFWKYVEESKYDYKIFVSKKCFVLYKVFMPLFDFDSHECIKVNDTAIPIYLNKMKGKEVLIIDDVLIHGRTSFKISEVINGQAKTVDFLVFAKNNMKIMRQDISTEKIDFLFNEKLKMQKDSTISKRENIYERCFEIKPRNVKEKTKKISLDKHNETVKGYIYCNNEYQWKRISDMVIKGIWSVNMPYVSYLPIFSISGEERLKLNKLFLEDNSYRQEKLGQYFSYNVQTNEDVKKNAIIHYCFVISHNYDAHNYKLVPMVFFDCENTSIDKTFIQEGLRIIYGGKVDSLLNYFRGNDTSNGGFITMLKYLIFCVGYLASKRLLSAQGIGKDGYNIDDVNAYYSFGNKIEEYLKILANVDEINLLELIERTTIKNNSCQFKKEEAHQEQQKYLHRGLDEAYLSTKSNKMEKNRKTIFEFLSRYFKYNNMYDEENLYKMRKEDYVRGLRFSEIKESLKKRKFDIKDIISGLMYQYNLGAATIDFLYDYGQRGQINGINMYWRAGEQSYKCISTTYVLIVYFQNLYYRLFDIQIASHMHDVFVELAEQNYKIWEIPFSKEDLKKYCGIKDDVYDAFDIDEYCEQEEFKYLGYIGKQMEQYVLFGYIQDLLKEDYHEFKNKLLDFMQKHTDNKVMNNCRRILLSEGNLK